GVVLRGAKGAIDAWPGESWRDYVPMLQTMVSLPVVVLAVAGMARALWRPERRDVPFWSWLLLIGSSIVLFVGHTEARYLLPALHPRAATHAVGAGTGPRPAGRVLEHVPLRAARRRVLRRPAAARPAAPQRTAERRHAAARRAGRRRRCRAPPERRQLLYLE